MSQKKNFLFCDSFCTWKLPLLSIMLLLLLMSLVSLFSLQSNYFFMCPLNLFVFIKYFSHLTIYCTYMDSRLLPSWLLVKIGTGPVHFMVTLDTLSGYPEPWSSKIWEVKSRALTILSVFIACVSSYLELHSTNMTQPTESMWLYT